MLPLVTTTALMLLFFFSVNYIFISTKIIFIDLHIKALSANFSLASFIYTFEHLKKLDNFFFLLHACTHS